MAEVYGGEVYGNYTVIGVTRKILQSDIHQCCSIGTAVRFSTTELLGTI